MPPLIFLSCCTFTVLPPRSALHHSFIDTGMLKLQCKTHGFRGLTFSHILPTSGTLSPKTSGTLLLLSVPSKANSRHFSSLNNSVKQHCPSPLSVCTVCMYVCVYIYMCASCTVLCLNPCRCVHYVLAFVKLWTTFFISIYIHHEFMPAYYFCSALWLWAAG